MHDPSAIKNGAFPHNKQNGPTRHGQRLLPQVLDTFAQEDPTHILGMAAKSSSHPVNFNILTTSQLSHAVNYTAHWITSLIPNDASTVSYIGVQDFRYWAMEFGAIKTGHALLLPATRNAVTNTASLLTTTKCRTIFYSTPWEPYVKALQTLIQDLQIFEVPSLETMITTPTPTTPFPYTKTWTEAQNDVILIVHTSGSTGNPKPIYYTNAWIGRCESDIHTPIPEGRVAANLDLLPKKKWFYLSTSFFHVSGIAFGFTTMFMGTSVVMGPPDVMPSGKVVCEIAKSVTLSALACVPSICDALVMEHKEDIKENFKELENICWFGGPLAQSTGDWITQNTKAHLWQFYGSTEVAWFPMLVPPRSHWSYMEFHPTLGPTLERISADSDLYEIVVHRHPDPAYAWTRPVFELFPHISEWRTRDLIKRCEDPGMENLWKFESRLDDVIILNNGLKVNPLHVEMRLQTHEALKGCLVFGDGRTKCGLLLEPKEDEDMEVLVEKIWNTVEETNRTLPEHARLAKDFVVVSTPDRPFPRAGKGTIIRALTVKEYEEEIESVYRVAT